MAIPSKGLRYKKQERRISLLAKKAGKYDERADTYQSVNHLSAR
jgi:hypothetical protein